MGQNGHKIDIEGFIVSNSFIIINLELSLLK
ncbi:hypothetical protein CLV51_10110 [Chitinophaga niastensis]|uniref:Uncharacterized protein n=1 Tax=Chitinophaga niastensis TaxID=536980 RepID=A0A2P8HR35_CHINA|nr:hypothetical protein CLV51_10110 [Chitinophaga niastensis]